MRRVVVTGAGVVAPIGVGLDAYWEGLASGRSGIAEVTSFDASSFATRIAAEVRDLRPESVVGTGPYAQALLRDKKAVFGIHAAREALTRAFGERRADSVYAPERLGLSVAGGLEVFDLGDLAAHASPQGIAGATLHRALLQAEPSAHLRVPADLGARTILAELGGRGPFWFNVSACAAGTQALGEAFLAIREGVADAVLAGGYDSMVNPLGLGGFCLLEAMSRRNDLGPGASRPFDAHRDGFVLGEGAAFCVLEEYGRALARGAHVLVEVLGFASTLDAYHVTDPRPDAGGAVAAMNGALAMARLNPSSIDYINAHGTSTPKNDALETAAIRAVFGPRALHVPVSSTKSQIGHLIGAAGAVEFLAGAFAVVKGVVPATLNLTHPDPACDLDYVTDGPRSSQVRTFLSNSFGFGGQNASIVAGVSRDGP